MHLIAIKDLKQPLLLKQRLRDEKELLLTSDGRPVAVLVDIGPAEDPDGVIQAIRDSRSRLALSQARDAARRAGTSGMTMREIEREITSARKARKAR
jgi:antitoxin (DNA-binding transcriptional repressor) of toxin-antitoxin stability system